MTAPAQSPPAVIPPLETEQQARELPQVRAIYEAMRGQQGAGRHANQTLIIGALLTGGVPAGAYDQSVIKWLAQYEPQMCASVAGMIQRAVAEARKYVADLATLRSALADAIACRSAVPSCKDCTGAKRCARHEKDCERARSYAALLDELGGVE